MASQQHNLGTTQIHQQQQQQQMRTGKKITLQDFTEFKPVTYDEVKRFFEIVNRLDNDKLQHLRQRMSEVHPEGFQRMEQIKTQHPQWFQGLKFVGDEQALNQMIKMNVDLINHTNAELRFRMYKVLNEIDQHVADVFFNLCANHKTMKITVQDFTECKPITFDEAKRLFKDINNLDQSKLQRMRQRASEVNPEGFRQMEQLKAQHPDWFQGLKFVGDEQALNQLIKMKVDHINQTNAEQRFRIYKLLHEIDQHVADIFLNLCANHKSTKITQQDFTECKPVTFEEAKRLFEVIKNLDQNKLQLFRQRMSEVNPEGYQRMQILKAQHPDWFKDQKFVGDEQAAKQLISLKVDLINHSNAEQRFRIYKVLNEIDQHVADVFLNVCTNHKTTKITQQDFTECKPVTFEQGKRLFEAINHLDNDKLQRFRQRVSQVNPEEFQRMEHLRSQHPDWFQGQKFVGDEQAAKQFITICVDQLNQKNAEQRYRMYKLFHEIDQHVADVFLSLCANTNRK